MGQSIIKVVFFAQLREVMAVDHLQLKVSSDDRLTVSLIVERLKVDFELFRKYIEQGNQFIAAINHQTVDLETALSSGDELALFPPVTGG